MLESANDERAALVDKIRQLEEKVASLEAWNTEKQRYQLVDIGEGTFAFALKQSMSGGEPPHYICANCYEHSEKSILQHTHLPSGSDSMTCHRCHAKSVIRHGYQPPSYETTEEDRARAALERCPICTSGRLKVVKVGPHPQMGAVGLQQRTLKCDNPACSHSEARMHDPAGRLDKR